MEWMLLPLKRYAQFSGRSRRKEYWMFVLLVFIIYVIAMFLDSMLGFGTTSRYADLSDTSAAVGFNSQGGILTAIAMLALFLPSLAVGVRRLHDTDRSGWWILIGLVPIIGTIVLLVFYCTDGTKGPNRFGPDPKGDTPAELAEKFS
ncbi:Uncharacterized membrane protein YhaH, DUF805 family [Sphingomonas laterariae]|uniref:Uncharacterized membrane protein YhaH, DUF805 family n=1 Tax=Edaphosphingomonas laterariae TaxID=861865 RepID=A0A239EQ85_9SPHN|nr:DUF805 domain-containing protein [Sphingomonas laterariae]SNS46807.1 Uncharacterized membrane protein YhaH, DUF805 family [Sphingomonas laterariae]